MSSNSSTSKSVKSDAKTTVNNEPDVRKRKLNKFFFDSRRTSSFSSIRFKASTSHVSHRKILLLELVCSTMKLKSVRTLQKEKQTFYFDHSIVFPRSWKVISFEFLTKVNKCATGSKKTKKKLKLTKLCRISSLTLLKYVSRCHKIDINCSSCSFSIVSAFRSWPTRWGRWRCQYRSWCSASREMCRH